MESCAWHVFKQNSHYVIRKSLAYLIVSAQRKVFKEDELIQKAQRETPRKAYLQANGRYSAYYRKDNGYRKLIFDIEDKKAVIVTFMDVDELPKVDLPK